MSLEEFIEKDRICNYLKVKKEWREYLMETLNLKVRKLGRPIPLHEWNEAQENIDIVTSLIERREKELKDFYELTNTKEVPKMDAHYVLLFNQLRQWEKKWGWKSLFFALLNYYRHFHYKEKDFNAYGFTRDKHNTQWMSRSNGITNPNPGELTSEK